MFTVNVKTPVRWGPLAQSTYALINVWLCRGIFHLVGGLEHFLFSQIYWECHHPNWLSYFSEGWPNHQPATHFHASWDQIRPPDHWNASPLRCPLRHSEPCLDLWPLVPHRRVRNERTGATAERWVSPSPIRPENPMSMGSYLVHLGYDSSAFQWLEL